MKIQKHKLLLLLAIVPLALIAYFALSYPFNKEIASETVYIGELSPEQINNIQVAAKALDGYIVKPGEQFSFNKAVGPRTFSRGYGEAPSYIGTESPATFGGGICLVSSAVYQLALTSGFPIVERMPHLRTVRSVLPGLDATVWYGKADLKFQNNLSTPIKIKANVDHNDISIKFFGDNTRAPVTIRRLITRRSADHIQVEVFRQINDKTTLVSRDLYLLAARYPNKQHNR